ncbi:hypothetical protein NCS57_01412600 [Fusarium keratoplasticum]|uniref:Uncharacterized protein n=1 Tax=Fusarium keratoplasticum TaxID=1328300 RepID=A0ACC0QDD0_9HYPO|nr:hypothetical protein NCS57_01412600 [Fusarium keratoplasticum]KAI8650777.1 hypothetical protein NCS57_01412600 [Fusarium keratoplasticum]KAI8651571.1 hypothetical protein NCS55_01402500 [Fusarium keratoplasticum]
MNSTQRVITDSNKSPLVQVLTMMFLVVAILSCFVRMGTKIHMIKALRVDDILTIVATVLSVAQSAVVFVACDHGLGKHFDTLSTDDIDVFFKTQYAINAMLIASLFCCKLSGTMSLRIMGQKSQKWIFITCEAVVGLWGLTALIVSFFQCSLPSPWLYDDAEKCINRTAFWTYYSIANIITDLAIVVVMCENVMKIRTSLSKKILVMSVFGSRILVTPAIAVQIYYTNRAIASIDFSFSIWQAAIAIQLVQCLAILTVCVPNFKPFLDSLESGQIRIDDLRRQGKSSSNGYPTNRAGYAGYKSAENSAMGSRSRTAKEPPTTQSQASQVFEMVDLPKHRTKAAGDATWDGQSRTSHSSQTILIHQTWQVDVENMHERERD